jgi:hypothetical protein
MVSIMSITSETSLICNDASHSAKLSLCA